MADALVERVADALLETGIVIGASSWPDDARFAAEQLARAAIAAASDWQPIATALGSEADEIERLRRWVSRSSRQAKNWRTLLRSLPSEERMALIARIVSVDADIALMEAEMATEAPVGEFNRELEIQSEQSRSLWKRAQLKEK